MSLVEIIPTDGEIKTREDYDRVVQLWHTQARDDFWAFRKFMRPDMVWGWFIEDVWLHLQQFYLDMCMGLRPKLALMAPLQHGKSWTVTDFAAWMAGKRPVCKTIFASFSDDLGVSTNLDVKRMIQSETYRQD
jgi:hypothetical protein